jgi:peptidoglycan/LPS O-acetylase OafA/YrhL
MKEQMIYKSNKVRSIEGIRGVACFMVVLSHLSLTFFPYLHSFALEADSSFFVQNFIHNSPFGFIYSGTSAVFIFFVLSGYILTYVASGNDIYKIIAMSLKRYPRLMIPVVVSCVLSYTLFSLVSVDKTMFANSIKSFGDFNFSFIGAIYSGFIGTFFIGESLYNPPLWTMKIELLGSFLVFGMCILKSKGKVPEIGIFLIPFLLVMAGVTSAFISRMLGFGLIQFIAGYLFYFYGRKIRPKLSIFIFLVGLYLSGVHNNSSSYSLIVFFFGTDAYFYGNFASGMLIVYSIIFNDRLNSFFSQKLFVFMGRVSFSVYLIHLPVISTIGVLFFNLSYDHFPYEMSAIGSSIIVIISSYLLSMVYFNLVDRPGMIISNKFQSTLLATADLFKNKVTENS